MTRTQPRDVARRFVRAHNPLQPPPLRLWHILLGTVLLAFLVAGVTGAGLMAEVGRAGLGGHTWHVTVWAIEGLAVLCLWAIVFVRSMHPLMYLCLSLEVVALALWLGITRTERLEFTVINAVLLMFAALVPVRVITRPNDTDRLLACQESEKGALQRAEAAEAEVSRLKELYEPES